MNNNAFKKLNASRNPSNSFYENKDQYSFELSKTYDSKKDISKQMSSNLYDFDLKKHTFDKTNLLRAKLQKQVKSSQKTLPIFQDSERRIDFENVPETENKISAAKKNDRSVFFQNLKFTYLAKSDSQVSEEIEATTKLGDQTDKIDRVESNKMTDKNKLLGRNKLANESLLKSFKRDKLSENKEGAPNIYTKKLVPRNLEDGYRSETAVDSKNEGNKTNGVCNIYKEFGYKGSAVKNGIHNKTIESNILTKDFETKNYKKTEKQEMGFLGIQRCVTGKQVFIPQKINNLNNSTNNWMKNNKKIDTFRNVLLKNVEVKKVGLELNKNQKQQNDETNELENSNLIIYNSKFLKQKVQLGLKTSQVVSKLKSFNNQSVEFNRNLNKGIIKLEETPIKQKNKTTLQFGIHQTAIVSKASGNQFGNLRKFLTPKFEETETGRIEAQKYFSNTENREKKESEIYKGILGPDNKTGNGLSLKNKDKQKIKVSNNLNQNGFRSTGREFSKLNLYQVGLPSSLIHDTTTKTQKQVKEISAHYLNFSKMKYSGSLEANQFQKLKENEKKEELGFMEIPLFKMMFEQLGLLTNNVENLKMHLEFLSDLKMEINKREEKYTQAKSRVFEIRKLVESNYRLVECNNQKINLEKEIENLKEEFGKLSEIFEQIEFQVQLNLDEKIKLDEILKKENNKIEELIFTADIYQRQYFTNIIKKEEDNYDIEDKSKVKESRDNLFDKIRKIIMHFFNDITIEESNESVLIKFDICLEQIKSGEKFKGILDKDFSIFGKIMKQFLSSVNELKIYRSLKQIESQKLKDSLEKIEYFKAEKQDYQLDLDHKMASINYSITENEKIKSELFLSGKINISGEVNILKIDEELICEKDVLQCDLSNLKLEIKKKKNNLRRLNKLTDKMFFNFIQNFEIFVNFSQNFVEAYKNSKESTKTQSFESLNDVNQTESEIISELCKSHLEFEAIYRILKRQNQIPDFLADNSGSLACFELLSQVGSRNNNQAQIDSKNGSCTNTNSVEEYKIKFEEFENDFGRIIFILFSVKFSLSKSINSGIPIFPYLQENHYDDLQKNSFFQKCRERIDLPTSQELFRISDGGF